MELLSSRWRLSKTAKQVVDSLALPRPPTRMRSCEPSDRFRPQEYALLPPPIGHLVRECISIVDPRPLSPHGQGTPGGRRPRRRQGRLSTERNAHPLVVSTTTRRRTNTRVRCVACAWHLFVDGSWFCIPSSEQ
eukprot:3784086-Pyramimonas_sp.AAC.1